MDPRGSRARRVTAGAFVAVMVLATAMSVATGLLDLVVPAVVGGATDASAACTPGALLAGDDACALPAGAPFAAMSWGAARWGGGYVAVHIFLHNLGLACVVPGVGLALLPREPEARLRRWIPAILYGAVVAALFSGALYGSLPVTSSALTLFALEATGVLALALGGYKALLHAVPAPERWPGAAARVAPFFAVSAAVLAVAAWYEVALLGAM